jgi:uncharacterized membrane protein HdeD (DUF308 family)
MMHSRTARLGIQGSGKFHAGLNRLERELHHASAAIASIAQTPDDHWAVAKERLDREFDALQREMAAYDIALGMVASTSTGATPMGLFDNGWVVALRGVLGIVLSAVILSRSASQQLSFVSMVGIYALLNGALQIVEAVSAGARQERWQTLLAAGIIGIVVGVFAIASPITTGLSMLVLALWAIAQGVLEAVAARRLRANLRDEWILTTQGTAWVVFGLLIAWIPMTRISALLGLFGAFLFASGLLLLSLGMRLWSIRRRVGSVGDSNVAELA